MGIRSGVELLCNRRFNDRHRNANQAMLKTCRMSFLWFPLSFIVVYVSGLFTKIPCLKGGGFSCVSTTANRKQSSGGGGGAELKTFDEDSPVDLEGLISRMEAIASTGLSRVEKMQANVDDMM